MHSLIIYLLRVVQVLLPIHISTISLVAITLCTNYIAKRLHLFTFLHQVLKVEENTLSYHAELEILDSAICKAKAMRITFHPDKCPTKVQINFDDAKGCVSF